MPPLAADPADDQINPYRHRVRLFPGRIFLLEGDEAEERELRSLIDPSSRPLLALGSGSGQHLLELSRRNPGAQCFGFELRYKRTVRTIEKAERDGLAQVFLLRTDARRAVKLFPEGCVGGIFVNFPDPWAKPKQWKHRLLSPRLLEDAHRLLAPDGFIAVKTDHEDMYGACLGQVADLRGLRVDERSDDLAHDPLQSQNILTEFETMFRSKRHPIRYVRLVRDPEA